MSSACAKPHAQQTATALKTFFSREKLRQEWVETLPPRKNLYRQMADLSDRKVDLVIAVGGDGTRLQATHRFRGGRSADPRHQHRLPRFHYIHSRTNPWIIRHRYAGHVELLGEGKPSLPWPPTNMVLFAEKRMG